MSPNELEHIYNHYNKRVYNTVLSYVQNAEDAEEITQDVFLEVYRSSENFKGDSSLSTWMYRIAINKCLDFIKFKNRKKRFAFISQLFDTQSGELIHDKADFFHPGVKIENKEKAAILFKAIHNLPQNQKNAFILSQLEGLSYSEISEVMQNTIPSVESLLFRAKENLRKQLGKWYKEE
jgi:RNA polymerase sigma-70 factor (ECF subfamily)